MGVILDPIGDMLARIRNAQMRGHPTTTMPYSKIKHQIARILTEEGYTRGYRVIALSETSEKKILKLFLKYTDKSPAIKGMLRISKPGRRIYTKVQNIPRIKGGFGIAVLSTPRGILTDKQAKLLRVGGEILCYVW